MSSGILAMALMFEATRDKEKVLMLEAVTNKMTQHPISTINKKCTILAQFDLDSSNISYFCDSHFDKVS